MDPVETIELQKATEADKPYLYALRRQTMIDHLEQAGIFLSEDEHWQRIEHEFDGFRLLFFRGERIGTIKYRENDESIEIIQLQIEPEHQGRGLGSAVVEQLIEDSRGKALCLSVLKKNPAMGLYRRLGFSITSEDEHEYLMQRQSC